LGVLHSGEKKAIAIACPRPAGQRVSPQRLDMMQMKEPVSFELWLEAADITMVIENGKLEPKLLPEHKSLFFPAANRFLPILIPSRIFLLRSVFCKCFHDCGNYKKIMCSRIMIHHRFVILL